MSPDGDFEGEPRAARVDPRLWKRLLGYAKPYRRQLVRFVGCALLVAACDASFPLVTRAVVDHVAAGGGPDGLVRYALAFAGLVVVLVSSILGFVSAGGHLRTAIGYDIRRDGFDNLQRLPFAYFDRRPVGWLMARMTSDCERLANVLVWGLLDLTWGVAVMASISVVLLALDARLALVVLSVVPLLAVVSVLFQRKILASSRIVRRTSSRLTAAYNEGLAAVVTSKAFVRERENAREFGALAAEMEAATVRNHLQSALYLPLVLMLAGVATAAAVGVGGGEIAAGALTLGTLVAFLAYARTLFEPVQELAARYAELQMAQAAAERIVGLIDEVPAIADRPSVRARIADHIAAPMVRTGDGLAADGLPDRVERIAFRGVGFAYAGGKSVLEGFDLDVRAGETIALVGPTGGGKSTIVSLLCRFYEPTAGAIEIDGVDYRERSLAWWQAQLGVVLQAPHLFGGTIEENVRYGRLDATRAEVEAAARVVGADALVASLPDGWDTKVGEGGARLSTGQKQLVAFARAVLADPRVLVMDEATSSIDTETERRIQSGLERVLAGRTSFVIAHRLSTIRKADRILVIDGGRIVEQGDHATLLALRGRYHELVTRQSVRAAARRQDSWDEGAAASATP